MRYITEYQSAILMATSGFIKDATGLIDLCGVEKKPSMVPEVFDFSIMDRPRYQSFQKPAGLQIAGIPRRICLKR